MKIEWNLNRLFLVAAILAFLMTFMMSGCSSAKTGCPANEAASVKIRKDGSLPTKRGKSHLFNKKMRKRMKH